jgi:hypothetical protein
MRENMLMKINIDRSKFQVKAQIWGEMIVRVKYIGLKSVPESRR